MKRLNEGNSARGSRKVSALFRSGTLLSVLTLALGFAVVFGVFMIVATPKRHDLKAGDIADTTITATKDIEDTIATQKLRDAAAASIVEGTTKLDNTTEIQIQNALDELCKGRTTIVVAHRLSTIKNADEIAVVSDGMIIEQGTHDSLIASGGKYADLYKLQFRNGESINATVEF